jgi:hypothetical protein
MNLKKILYNCEKCEYILSFFLILIFYMFGYHLSYFIDLVFLIKNKNKDKDLLTINDSLIIGELVIEFGIAILIQNIFEKYHTKLLDPLYNAFNSKPPNYIYYLITIAFALGIFRNLKNMENNGVYIKEKYKKIIVDKLNKNTFFQKYLSKYMNTFSGN